MANNPLDLSLDGTRATRPPRVAGLVLAVGFLSTTPCLYADTYQQGINMTAGAEYDSNPSLAKDHEKSVWRGLFTPDYQLQWQRDENEVLATADLRIERSSDTSLSKNREDPSLSLEWIGTNPRGEARVKGSYDETDTRVTEFEDTGEVRPDATRTRWYLESGLNRALSERTQVGVELGYQDLSYNDATFTDYTNADLGLNFTYLLSETVSPLIQLGASRYDPEESATENRTTQGTSESYSFATGAEWKLNEFLESTIKAGIVHIDEENNDTNWSGSVGLKYYGERLEAALDVERSTSASGSGGYAEADSAIVNLTYNYSQVTSLGGSINWRDNRSGSEIEAANASLWAERELNEFWSIRTSWQFRRQDSNHSGEAHVLLLSVRYNVPLKS